MTTKMTGRKSLLLLSVTALITVTALPVQRAHAATSAKMPQNTSMKMAMPGMKMPAATSGVSQKTENVVTAPASSAKSAVGAGASSSTSGKGVLLKYQVSVGAQYRGRKVTIVVSDKEVRNGAKIQVATVAVDKNGFANFLFPAVIGPNDTVTTTLSTSRRLPLPEQVCSWSMPRWQMHQQLHHLLRLPPLQSFQ